MKKILLAVMILTVFCSLNVFAEEVIDIKLEGNCISVSDYTPLETMPSLLDTESEYDIIVKGLDEQKEEIEVSYNISYEDFVNDYGSSAQAFYNDYAPAVSDYYLNAVFSHPEFLHVATNCGMPANINGNIIDGVTLKITLQPLYVVDSNQRAQAISNADGIIADIIEPEMTDEEKVLVLHDYIIDTTDYNTEYANTIGRPSTAEHWQNHTAYGVFVNGKAVCQGYALAYNFLLNRVGIENKYVSGTAKGGGHGWSVVKIGDNWYHVDPTHDDPSNVECVDHSHFLLSDSQIYALGHTEWETTVECNDGNYNAVKYCFHGVNPKVETIKYNYNNGMIYARRHLHLVRESDSSNYFDLSSIYNYSKRYKNGEVDIYRNNDGIYYVYDYVKSNFDGSAFEIITEEEYNNAFVEQYEYDINPICVNENGVAEEITLNNIGDSTIYIKNEKDTQYNPDVYVVFYDGNGKVISSSYFSSEGKNVSVDISTVKPSEEFARFSLFVWADGTLIPMAENYTVE